MELEGFLKCKEEDVGYRFSHDHGVCLEIGEIGINSDRAKGEGVHRFETEMG